MSSQLAWRQLIVAVTWLLPLLLVVVVAGQLLLLVHCKLLLVLLLKVSEVHLNLLTK